jgi:hypothetical protein
VIDSSEALREQVLAVKVIGQYSKLKSLGKQWEDARQRLEYY